MSVKFEKKLVILKGLHDSSRATVTIESNNYGVSCHISAILSDLDKGQYLLAVKTNFETQVFLLGMSGRINVKFELDENIGKSDTVHCVLFLRYGSKDRPYLYGTNGSVKLWEGNMMDGVKRGDSTPSQTAQTDKDNEASKPSEEIKKCENDFEKVIQLLDSNEYNDDAIATVNFYDYYKNELEKTDLTQTDEEVATSQEMQQPKQPIQDSQPEYNFLQQDKSVETKSPSAETDQNVELPHNKERRFLENYYNIAYENINKRPVDNSYMPKDGDTIGINQLLNDKNIVQNQTNTNVNSQGINLQSDEKLDSAQNNVLKYHSSTIADTSRTFGVFSKGTNFRVNSNDPNEIVDIPKIQQNGSIVTQSAKNNRALTFYERISEQLNNLFDTYPVENKLNQILPDTRWVRIDYDNSGRYYCIGLIGVRPDYICYAVPSIYTETPPKELDGYCQWLPLDDLSPKSNGYWILYQDAVTGESITTQF